MLSGAFDPFSRLETNNGNAEELFPSIHVGVVKSYKISTNSVMVLVNTVNTSSEIGPCKVMRNYGTATGTRRPVKGDKVIVAFLDGKLNSAVVLGYL